MIIIFCAVMNNGITQSGITAHFASSSEVAVPLDQEYSVLLHMDYGIMQSGVTTHIALQVTGSATRLGIFCFVTYGLWNYVVWCYHPHCSSSEGQCHKTRNILFCYIWTIYGITQSGITAHLASPSEVAVPLDQEYSVLLHMDYGIMQSGVTTHIALQVKGSATRLGIFCFVTHGVWNYTSLGLLITCSSEQCRHTRNFMCTLFKYHISEVLYNTLQCCFSQDAMFYFQFQYQFQFMTDFSFGLLVLVYRRQQHNCQYYKLLVVYFLPISISRGNMY